MKSHIFCFAAALLGAFAAQAAELATFDEVRSQYQSYKDPTRVSYLYNRCAALQLNVAALLARKGQAKPGQDFEALAQHYMVLSEANEREIDKKRGLKSKDTMKTVHRNVATVSEVYSQRMKKNSLQTGEYVRGDAQLENELQDCMNPDTFVKKLSNH
jgi:cytochrome c1